MINDGKIVASSKQVANDNSKNFTFNQPLKGSANEKPTPGAQGMRNQDGSNPVRKALNVMIIVGSLILSYSKKKRKKEIRRRATSRLLTRPSSFRLPSM